MKIFSATSIAKLVIAAVLLINFSCGSLGGIIVSQPQGGGSKRSEPTSYPSYRVLNIPNGHLPPPGHCRIWYPSKPAGQQPPPVSCDKALRDFKIGTWIITRADADNNLLEVREQKKIRGREE